MCNNKRGEKMISMKPKKDITLISKQAKKIGDSRGYFLGKARNRNGEIFNVFLSGKSTVKIGSKGGLGKETRKINNKKYRRFITGLMD